MMGGHKIDELWWWGRQGVRLLRRPRRARRRSTRANAAVDRADRQAAAPRSPSPPGAQPIDRADPIGGGKTVGNGRFARAAGDAKRVSERLARVRRRDLRAGRRHGAAT